MYIIARLASNIRIDCKAEQNFNQHSCHFDPYNPPTVIHWSLEAAKKEAARLAKKHPDTQFMVFRAVDAVICPVAPVMWISL